jgi:hypothetical protein
MIKKSFIMISMAGLLFACNDAGGGRSNIDSAKIIADTMAADKTVVDTADNKIIQADTSTAKPVTADKLISPGKGIGQIMLNGDVEKVIKMLGRPDSSDAAMGSALMVWFAKHDIKGYRTSIFAHRDMGGKDENVNRIQKVLITSPWFKTGEQLGVGSTLDEIKKFYTLKPTSSYKNSEGKVQVYTDMDKGISFEISEAGQKCVGVVVHKPHDTAAAYLNMH